MLLTFDELSLSSAELTQAKGSAWAAAFPVGGNALLVFRFLRRKGDAFETRTMLTTANGLCRSLPSILPTSFFGAYAMRFQDDMTIATPSIDQVWLPASDEEREGVLVRFAGEEALRDGALQLVPDAVGRSLFIEVRPMTWLSRDQVVGQA